MAGKKGMKHYSREVKREAVRLYEEEGKSQAEIIEALGIKATGPVKRWLHQYREEGEADVRSGKTQKRTLPDWKWRMTC